MADIITVPESFSTYLKNSAVRTAVDQLLSAKSNSMDRGFLWGELRQYHEALFSACQVRRDYTIMLFDLMDEICLTPAHEKGLKEISLGDKESCYDEEGGLPTPQTIWDDGLYCYVNKPIGKEVIGFCLGDDGTDGNLEILLYTDVEIDKLKPQGKWSLDDDGWWRLNDTNRSLNAEEISIKELRESVNKAIDSILENL